MLPKPEGELISSIVQRKLFHRIEWRLYNDKLFYSNKNIFHSIERDLSFEELTNKRIFERTTSAIATVIAILFLIAIGVRTVFIFNGVDKDGLFSYLVQAAITPFIALYAYSKDSSYVLTEASVPKYLLLYAKRPNEETVTNFLAKYKETCTSYLIKKYLENTDPLDLKQKENTIDALKTMCFISDKEGSAMMEKINNINSPTRNPIGFIK